jgi:hypothetical protein
MAGEQLRSNAPRLTALTTPSMSRADGEFRRVPVPFCAQGESILVTPRQL